MEKVVDFEKECQKLKTYFGVVVGICVIVIVILIIVASNANTTKKEHDDLTNCLSIVCSHNETALTEEINKLREEGAETHGGKKKN